MSTRRVLKASEAIREVVSTAILLELNDPRIRDVTVTYVEVSPDMRNARVNVSVMGDEAKQKLAMKGLQNSAGFLQRKVGDRIETRYTPKIVFRLDKGIKNSAEISRILDEVLPRDKPTGSDSAGSDTTGSNTTGSDTAGSDTAGSDTGGSDSKVSSSPGTESGTGPTRPEQTCTDQTDGV